MTARNRGNARIKCQLRAGVVFVVSVFFFESENFALLKSSQSRLLNRDSFVVDVNVEVVLEIVGAEFVQSNAVVCESKAVIFAVVGDRRLGSVSAVDKAGCCCTDARVNSVFEIGFCLLSAS